MSLLCAKYNIVLVLKDKRIHNVFFICIALGKNWFDYAVMGICMDLLPIVGLSIRYILRQVPKYKMIYQKSHCSISRLTKKSPEKWHRCPSGQRAKTRGINHKEPQQTLTCPKPSLQNLYNKIGQTIYTNKNTAQCEAI